MSKLDNIAINQKLLHSYESGDTLAQQLSQFPEAKQQIKALFLELMKQSFGKSIFGETTARDIYVRNLRQKVQEL